MRSLELRLLHLLCLLGLAAAQCWHDGRILRKGELLPYPQDSCFNRVCRCESWDRCRLEVERKVVLVKVKETTRAKRSATGAPGPVEARVRTLECKCVEDLAGSSEMNFFCAGPHLPGRNVAANLIGCPDMNGELRLPGQAVTIQTARMETMQCDCDPSGHYVNCIGQHELRDGCRDAEGRRVALGAHYNRTVRLESRTVRLLCKCSKSDQATACSVIGA